MESGGIEISAPNVEEAISRGLAQLGVTRPQVDVEVVDQGSRGLLGLGARNAVVRLTPIEAQEEPEEATPEPAQVAQPQPPSAPRTERQEKPAATEYEWSDDQVAETARQTVSELLSQMGIECTVTVRHPAGEDGDDTPLTLDIEGEDLRVLIGKRGEVLDALQYTSRLIVSREVSHWVDLVLDVEHYKQRRAESLKELAGRIAQRVARTRQPVALEPMPPNERRAIHIALRDHPSVTTQSVGKGDKRKVTIIPKR